jgi:hypothetical protein
MKIKLLSAAVILFTAFFLFSGHSFPGNGKTSAETYSKIKIYLNSPSDLAKLQEIGITIEHYEGSYGKGIDVVVNNDELNLLKRLQYRYETLISNMDEYYANRIQSDANTLAQNELIKQQDGIDAFGYGSMGGFHTYTEMVQKLDSMILLFPNLISTKMNLGTSHEGRTIWGIKISDNPNVNESATEPVIYYDALHHAREPIGMSVILYYMYWLLENYNTNPEAQYLVNNREIYFVPIVNPDGYVYNQTTNPNGGGMWRKNRRNNSGSFGVDLNRNYPYGWGLNSGSSGTPSSDTYRGPSAGSEPETQAVMTLVNAIDPKISFSNHSVAGRLLNPYGYTDTAAAYQVYADFTSDFAPTTDYLYGTVIEMLDYYSSGTTRDYLHSIGTYCWTPEIGGSDFWPLQSEIIPLVSSNLFSMKYLTWVGGAYARFQNYRILGPGYAGKTDTLNLEVAIRNKGLSKTSKNVVVDITTSYPNVAAMTTSVNYDSIQARQTKVNATPFKYRVLNTANNGDEIKFVCTVSQEGVVASRDTFSLYVGRTAVLFSDNGESGITNWTRSGTGTQWDTTYVSSWAGQRSFADSRYGNSKNSSNNFFSLTPSVNLAGTINPRIEFAAKWATETNFDYARLQISTNNGTSWVNLAGKFTRTVSGQPSYTSIKYWVYEQASLQPYIGSTIKIRFNYVTDNGVPGDGFYFDNFRVVDYRDVASGITSTGSSIPEKYELYQNFPNPFNPATKIKFDVPFKDAVSLSVFDITGREVAVLFNGEISPGSYEVNWDASSLTSGVYFYKLITGSYSATRKMLLIK